MTVASESIALRLSASDDAYVESRSVAQLIASRLDPVDPWRLALVQRHLVWDEVRISHLLDSLLAGYPIGSLLVCRVRQAAHILEEVDGTRRAKLADAGTWQLLDGQQRVNALVAIFTDQGKFGRFYLDVTKRRIPEEVVTRRRDARRALDYIGWRADDTSGTEPLDGRERYIDLSRIAGWAAPLTPGELDALVERLTADPRHAIAVLNEIDDAFADDLSGTALDQAAERLIRLLRAWSLPSIPVQHFTVDSPVDVLQVFSRINLAGVRLDGEDVFFAAVKTQWHDAEEHLDRVAAASPLLNRMTALRILARLASRAQSGEDLLPLRVDRLNGPKGQRLITTMRRLAGDDSPVMVRLGVLGRLLTTESSLGFGLKLIDDKLLDHVFAWAAVNADASDEVHVRDRLPLIEAYLVGAHAFRYPSIFLDRYLRLAFAEAVAAGIDGQPFPLERIIAGARRRWPNLSRGQQSVAPLVDDGDRRRLIDRSAGMFLSILQHLPFGLPLRDPEDPGAGRREVEWDHIYPQARANLMRVPHPQTGRLVHHADRRLVWEAGNLWALDRPINNSASDSNPSTKFAFLDNLPLAARQLPSRWPTEADAQLAPPERAELLAAESLIGAGDVASAMPRFRAYVEMRGLRMFRAVMAQFPAVELFAPSAPIDQDLFEDARSLAVAAALGLDDVPEEVEDEPVTASGTSAPEVDPERFAHVLAVAEEAGLADELRSVVATAMDLGLAIRPNRGSVMIAPSTNRTRMLFTVWPQASRDGGRLSIYRWAPAVAEFFPSIDEAAARTALGPDGFGSLERQDVEPFLTRLRTLIGPLTAAAGGRLALSGNDIRRIAGDWLRSTDPDQVGVHYYQIAAAVGSQGTVGGKNTTQTVWKAIASHGDLFDSTGPGTYTWKSQTAAALSGGRTRYWAMRTDPNKRAELWPELLAGRLRQGWGWDPEMDLELVADLVAAKRPLTEQQQQAWANRRMLTSQADAIHVGDIVLVPHMPEHRRFSLVRVTGPYEFDGGRDFGDYGHILPVKLLTDSKGVGYTDPSVALKLQTSLGNRVRLWNLDAFGPSMEELAGVPS